MLKDHVTDTKSIKKIICTNIKNYKSIKKATDKMTPPHFFAGRRKIEKVLQV